MKKLNLFFFAILAMAFAFTSCNNDDDGGTNVTLTQAQQDSIAVYTAATAAMDAQFAADNNVSVDPAFTAGTIQPTASAATENVIDASTINAFFTATTYRGAVPTSGAAWYAGWSFYDRLVAGNTTDIDRSSQVGTKTTVSGTLSGTVNWVKTNTYVLDGFVFVESGATLNIEAGTVIQGMETPTTGDNASALIVARGGTIMATGTSSEPIIFTYDGDDLDGTVDATVSGKWGGLIVLGNAGLNSTPGETQIEGIPDTETKGLYGGSTDTDNSGTLRYISIRHGGSEIGAGNEINGLTLGGVGSGTIIEFVEIIGNKDDGIEWFGGTVNGKWLISAFCGDDALDYDEGYRGMNQWVIVHQNPAAGAGDRGGEHDGGTDPETGTPFAIPHFVNVTSVGNSENRTLTFRDNAGGFYINSIFTGYNRGVDIEAFSNGSQSSYTQFTDGNLKVQSSIFNVGGSTYVPTVVIK